MIGLVLLVVAAADPCGELPTGDVLLKSRTATFNLIAANETGAPRLFFQVHEGRICARLVADQSEPWRSFIGRGAPELVREISADGRNLIAIDDDGVVHYTKLHAIQWTDRWLALPLVGTINSLLFGGELFMPPNRGWSISHRGPENAYYEDVAGKKHPIGAGVTTLYVLSADGSSIHYADPWLPNGWNNDIPMPEGGRFVAEVMSASASTLFLLARARDHDGRESHRMYTRLIDFDTEGNNPFLPYTYVHGDPDPAVRTLPAEDWRLQPTIPISRRARLTDGITIFQSGEGNGARTLRVEGTNAGGQSGYWQKQIYDQAWNFISTGHTIGPARFLDASHAEETTGTITLDCPHGILQHRPRIPWLTGESVPATLTGFADGVAARVRVEVGEETVELAIYSRRRLRNLIADDPPSHTLVIPDRYFNEPRLREHEELQRLLDTMFNGQRAIPVVVDREEDELSFESKAFSRARFELSFVGCGPSP